MNSSSHGKCSALARAGAPPATLTLLDHDCQLVLIQRLLLQHMARVRPEGGCQPVAELQVKTQRQQALVDMMVMTPSGYAISACIVPRQDQTVTCCALSFMQQAATYHAQSQQTCLCSRAV